MHLQQFVLDRHHPTGSYRLRDGSAYRNKAANRAVGGHPKSTHLHRLARDLMLDVYDYAKCKWVYQRSTKAYKWFGEYWETLHPRARWGGRWDDGNHFSFEWRGVK